jgi:hypothetical protein
MHRRPVSIVDGLIRDLLELRISGSYKQVTTSSMRAPGKMYMAPDVGGCHMKMHTDGSQGIWIQRRDVDKYPQVVGIRHEQSNVYTWLIPSSRMGE